MFPSVRFRWPLRMQDDWHHILYSDLDPNPGLLDYDCRALTYDGHNGNDTFIPDFGIMDEGRYVLAAAPGTVILTEDGHFDRNTTSIPGTPTNWVGIEHEDGTVSYYLLRR